MSRTQQVQEQERERERLRQEAIAEYIALAARARMQFQLSRYTHRQLRDAVAVIEGANLGYVRAAADDLRHVLDEASRISSSFHGLANDDYLYFHFFRVNNNTTTTMPWSYVYVQDPPADRTPPPRPQAKIPGQAPRFQNYRR